MLTLAELGTEFHFTTLPTGTRVALFERPGAPVYVRASFLSGSRFDDDNKQGTAHLLEHMLVAGTKRFPSKDKLAAYIEQYGGIFRATTSNDSLDLNVAIGDPKDLEKAFVVLREMLSESLFEERTLATERESVLGEIRDRISSPAMRVWDVAARLMFQGTPLAKSTGGIPQQVGAITGEDVQSFFRSNIGSQRLLLTVSGGVTLQQVLAQAEQSLAIPASTLVSLDKPQPVQRDKIVEIERYTGKEQVHMVCGFRTVPAQHPDVPTLDVVATVLGGGRASVLNRQLRYERGLVYGVSAWQREFTDAGIWVVKTSATKEKLQEVFNIIQDNIERVRSRGLTADEVQFAKDKIEKSKRMELQTSASWVDFHSASQLISPSPWTLTDYLAGISMVTPEMTKRVAQQYFKVDQWYAALCGDVDEGALTI